MRDFLLTMIIAGSVPATLVSPFVGVLVWSWIGYMNPHRWSWGFAYDFPFAAIVASATLLGLVFTREPKRLPTEALAVALTAFAAWMSFTTLFAFYPDVAMEGLKKALKVILFSLVTISVVQDRKRLDLLIWVIVLSLGFFAAKGGIFTLLRDTGGRQLVYGPPDSFIQDNNSLALAVIMAVPLMIYLRTHTQNKWVKRGLLVVMLLSAVSVIGSHSRGAMLAAAGLCLYLIAKSRHRVATAIMVVVASVAALIVAPENWFERMETTRTYEQDPSAMGRINAWWMAFNIANDRPLVGGGFHLGTAETFARYAPVPEDIHEAHSIFFQVLGEHGYVGLALFLTVGWLTLRYGNRIRRMTRDREDLRWAYDLAGMLQAGVIGYAVGGAFLSLAYFDFFYHLVAMMTITHFLVAEALRGEAGDGQLLENAVPSSLEPAEERFRVAQGSMSDVQHH
jgi:probable O-glycosylation ligase (exosortase A-associated)